VTGTQPLILDLDDDSEVEVLLGSNQGGLFAWELQSDQSLAREDGWPLVYSDRPFNPAVADLDDDGTLELVVPSDDGTVHVYDLPADADQAGWMMAGYDIGRTGTIPITGGSQGTERPNPGDGGWRDRDGIVFTRTLAGDGGAVVRFHSAAAQHARLRIFDVAGREVVELLDNEVPGGYHDVHWNHRTSVGIRTPAGVYFVRLNLGAGRFDTRLVVVR